MKIRASCQAVWPVTYVSRIGVRASTRRYYNAVRNATAFTWKPSAPSFLDGVRNRSCACATPARSPPTNALHPPSATSECLQLRRAPPDVCTDEWTTDGCLRSPVPLCIPHATVEACFRCCMLYATAPLRANAAFWRRAWLAESRDPWGKGAAGKACGALGRALGFDDDASVLLTALSGARHADAGATYANATLVTAPLWRSRPRPMYTYIHGWGLAPQPRCRTGGVRPAGPHVLHTRAAASARHNLPRLEDPARAAAEVVGYQPRRRSPSPLRLPAGRQVERAMARGAALRALCHAGRHGARPSNAPLLLVHEPQDARGAAAQACRPPRQWLCLRAELSGPMPQQRWWRELRLLLTAALWRALHRVAAGCRPAKPP